MLAKSPIDSAGVGADEVGADEFRSVAGSGVVLSGKPTNLKLLDTTLPRGYRFRKIDVVKLREKYPAH